LRVNKKESMSFRDVILWRATVQVGEVRIIAFRPAGHTEVDYLFNVQVIDFCRLRSVCRNYSRTKNQKLTNVFRLPAFMPTCCKLHVLPSSTEKMKNIILLLSKTPV